MKIILLTFLIAITSEASVVGISTHPMNDEGKILSAQMTGYMSRRQEVGMGLRYTQEVAPQQRMDVIAAGAQESRSLILGGGIDFEVLSETNSAPRAAMKPFYQYEKFEEKKSSLFGLAPTIRKGLNINNVEFFPYFGIPFGLKIDHREEIIKYAASLTLGASMPFPNVSTNNLLLSIETNRDLNSSSDYLAGMVSWVWK